MKISGKSYRSIWWDEDDPASVKVIDQEKLPFSFEIKELISHTQVYNAIYRMTVRGAPVIGAAGAFGMYLATLQMKGNWDRYLKDAGQYLISCRPTAVNLSWAVKRSLAALEGLTDRDEIQKAALRVALEICELEVENCRAIGGYGVELIEEISRRKGGQPVNILTHCNAGWLATIDYGTATAPVYLARDRGIAVHVWVDETRPRNQGARLTAFELENENIPYSLIADNTGGHLMQHGMVDLVITGSDRTALSGDTANKIGTYLKALAAKDNNVPFYVALPSSSIDFSVRDGVKEIPVEERDPSEVTDMTGYDGEKIISVRICPDKTKAVNFGFDITPARLITGLITERGICGASEESIGKMFPDKLSHDYGRGC
jgi:methylthioribose-1-phosphate isomerase